MSRLANDPARRGGQPRFLLVLLLSTAGLSGCWESPTEPAAGPEVKPELALVGPTVSISAGYGHTCAIGSDGAVACWGYNGQGQATVPAGLGPVTQVSTGSNHTCAVKGDGSITCWGANYDGQASVPLGLGPVTQVSAGYTHTCAVRVDGYVVCWGNSFDGKTTVPAGLGPVTQVSVGASHTCAVKGDGSVTCWGANYDGQASVPAGLGPVTQVSAGAYHTCVVEGDGSVACWGRAGLASVPAGLGPVTQVSAGSNHTCAVKGDDTVVCWGANYLGQASVPAGLGSVMQVSAGGSYTCAVRGDGSVTCWGWESGSLIAGSFTDVAPGGTHTCAVKGDGSVVCWGDNLYGKTSVPAGLGVVTQVSAGVGHTCGVRGDGSVACWGVNSDGQASVPAGLGVVTQVSAGGNHTCAVEGDGSVACWGNNYYGQTSVPAGLGPVAQVSAAAAYTCAVKDDGTVSCWGYNGRGQTSVPAGLGAVTQVSSGGNHTCAVKGDGSVACWGYAALASVPAGLGTVMQVSAGAYHTCALKGDGSVVCWGASYASVPEDLGTVLRLAVSSSQSCAVKTDNTIECWGNPTSTTYLPPDPGSTPTGNGVSVQPVDQTTGDPAPVDLSFDNVTSGGTTTVTSGTVGSGGHPAPVGFRLGSPPTYYDVETTAVFSGSVTLCFDYSGASYGNESKLKLLHYDNGAWTDVTTSIDTSTKTICGTVTSLSPFLVAEQNVAPVVTATALPADPAAVGTSVTATASFTDANPGDEHTAGITWGDGETSAADVTESAGAGSATGSHTYAAAGVYTLVTVVSDGDLTGSRSSSEDQPAYIVVFDPSGGFVTGGGWFDSPEGACLWSGCAADGTTTGRASFGFVSRYKKGATTPTGNTEFQFKAAGLSFHSTSYQWLVVAGARAQYKGEGQIDGDGATYGFLITAIDGAVAGGGGTDRFRIKVWKVDTGEIAYDNQMGELEDSNSATAIGGGSIVIHK